MKDQTILMSESAQINTTPKGKSLREVKNYIIVGFGGAILDFALFYALFFLGTPILIAQWCGAGAGFLHNHLWHHYKVFTHSKKFRFTTTASGTAAIVGVIISGPALTILEKLIPNLFINKIIIVGIITIFLFIIRKRWIFTEKSHRVPANH